MLESEKQFFLQTPEEKRVSPKRERGVLEYAREIAKIRNKPILN